jgi:inosine-uridine nucleoside N-ribohydrolase
MSLLAQRLLAVHDALDAAVLPHAFGGAIALAYCTEEPRGTRDLDVNVFVDPTRAREVFAALPSPVVATSTAVEAAERDGQARVLWEDTPIDVFLDIHRFHEEVAREVREVPFMDRTIPVLCCTCLAVFKALFDRTKDWADIEAMVEVGAMDVPEALAWLEGMVGAEHSAARRMASLGV